MTDNQLPAEQGQISDLSHEARATVVNPDDTPAPAREPSAVDQERRYAHHAIRLDYRALELERGRLPDPSARDWRYALSHRKDNPARRPMRPVFCRLQLCAARNFSPMSAGAKQGRK